MKIGIASIEIDNKVRSSVSLGRNNLLLSIVKRDLTLSKCHHIIFIIIALFSMLFLSGCDPECDLQLKECESSKPKPGPVKRLLSDMDQFKQSIASSAGNDSIALRSFQTASTGDIWIRNPNDNSLQNYTGNVQSQLAIDDGDEIRTAKNLASLSVDIVWKRSYKKNRDVGFELINAALDTAFKYEKVKKLNLKITVIDASLIQFVEPGIIYEEYLEQFQDNKVKGNVLVTGIVTGRLRVEFTAYGEEGQGLTLSSEIMAEGVNNSPGISSGYAIESSSSSYYGAIEESFDDSTVFAVTYFTIPRAKQDQVFINSQIEKDDYTPQYVKRIPFVDVSTGLALGQYEIYQEKTRSGKKEQLSWFLRVRNTSQPPINYYLSYYLQFYNVSGEYLFTEEGFIERIEAGEVVNVGVISREDVLLKFVEVNIEGGSYTRLE